MSVLETLRAEIAGVPAFVVPDGPRVPVVGLTFRVGRADETAATSGLSHLVEHLALPATTATPFDFNGTVDTLFTSLFASGDLDDLRDFVATTSGLLAEPPRGATRDRAQDSRGGGEHAEHRRRTSGPRASLRSRGTRPARLLRVRAAAGGLAGGRRAGRRSGSRRPAPPSGSPERRSTTSVSSSSSLAEDAARSLRSHARSTTSRHRPSTPRAPAWASVSRSSPTGARRHASRSTSTPTRSASGFATSSRCRTRSSMTSTR